MVCGGSAPNTLPVWVNAATRVDLDTNISMPDTSCSSSFSSNRRSSSDSTMGFGERAMSAAGAAVLSVILVNPLDVAKTRLQAQAAGVLYNSSQHHSGGYMAFLGPNTVGIYLPCYDIFRNWIEEFTSYSAPYLTPYAPLVAGAGARSLACITCYPIELARTRMQAFKVSRNGAKPPGILKTLLGVLSTASGTTTHQSLQSYRVLWMGAGAQLARDVPFSAICWSTLETIRRRLLTLVGEDSNVASVLGANFSAGFIAGSLAAAATCPLDVAKTRRQIEKDTTKALKMTTRQTLVDIWRSGGVKGLFTGVGPRVGRAGPSVGIVVSFYEIVKYGLPMMLGLRTLLIEGGDPYVVRGYCLVHLFRIAPVLVGE